TKVASKESHLISSSTIKNNVKISSAAQRIVQKVLDRTKKLEKEDKGIEAQLKQVLLNQKLMLEKEKEEIINQKKMLFEEDILLKEGVKEIKDDEEIVNFEKKQAEELKKLEELEKEIEKHIEPHPLLKVGFHDVIRGSLGALAGVVIHYTFVYGVKVAEQLTIFRASMLFVLCFLVGFVFLYVTGFRKVHDRKVMFFMPVRLVILYLVSLAMSIIVLWFFFPNFGYNYTESYKQVASVMLPALIGACTADLIGKE
ncbi:MAG: DUF2391 family protein, partial [Candidatus Woesearchaeota archaeon]